LAFHTHQLWFSTRDFGNHVKNIRNSIAHIIRNSQNNINLQLDNTEQNVYLENLARILKKIAKYKLDTEYNFCKLADKSITSSYDISKFLGQKMPAFC